MADQWYYSHRGQQVGPVSPEQLRQAAAVGQLQRTDLVWKQGMAAWVPAEKLKGLFPPTISPSADLPSSIPTAIPLQPMLQAEPIQPITSPALWNPMAAGAWSLLFSWAFGSFLLARNWKALGNEAKATRCMIWFYSFFTFVFLAVVTPDTAAINNAFRFFGLVILVVWALVEMKPQVDYINLRFGDGYRRQPWGKSIGIAVVCVFVAIGALIFLGVLSAVLE